jgi:hypothetical protein
MTCSDFIHNGIKLVFDTYLAMKSCTTTFDLLPVESHCDTLPDSIQIGMESTVTSYYIGVTDEEEELELS